jgi:hypothetical protein
MIQIKFTTHGANAAFGAFGPGDTARVSPELAAHFVEVCKCAKYVQAPVADHATQEPTADAQKQRGRPKKHP